MARKRRVSDRARKVTVLLTPSEELALQIIEARRRTRREERDSPSEIVSDAVWRLLEEVEGVSREMVDSLLPNTIPQLPESNVRKFPK